MSDTSQTTVCTNILQAAPNTSFPQHLVKLEIKIQCNTECSTVQYSHVYNKDTEHLQ